jgi:protein-S-isoprenylcysteine O-methyltransferase Ste14
MLVRVLLFSGLIIRKAVWEIWKRKGPAGIVHQSARNRFNPPANVKTQSTGNSLFKKAIKLCKIGFLLFLIAQSLFLDVLPIKGAPFILKYAGLALFFLGLGISILGRVHLGENWIELEERQVLPSQVLVTRGIYRYIRHPIYLGDVLLLTGFELALNSWLFVLGFFIAMIVIRQAFQEEELLSNAFPEYVEYRLRTKRFLPFVF